MNVIEMDVIKEKILGELGSLDGVREGVPSLVEYLERSDYFIAPASTIYHGAEEGGLASHSWNVMTQMRKLCAPENATGRFEDDSVVLVGLLHDVCKIGVYKGVAGCSRPTWRKADKFKIGHGEKSVICLLKETDLVLREEEMLAIRYHMNMFDDAGYAVHEGWNKLGILCFLADYYVSTFVDGVVGVGVDTWVEVGDE